MGVSTIPERNIPFGLSVQLGQVPGITFTNKFGRNAATATGDAIWSASVAWAFPAAAQTVDFVSSSANDAAAGTGARTLYVTGIDNNYDIVSETVTLNGTTPVATSNSYWNIHRAYVATAGSALTAAGSITGTQTTSATAMAYILVGYNESQSAIYMVPRNYTAYIDDPKLTMQTATANLLMDIGLFKKDFGATERIQSDFLLTGGGDTMQAKMYSGPFKFEEKTVVVWRCISASSAADVSVEYDIFLVRN